LLEVWPFFMPLCPECVEGKFSEIRQSHIGRISTAPRRHNLMTSSTIQRRCQEK
jgi:hypothetical protein